MGGGEEGIRGSAASKDTSSTPRGSSAAPHPQAQPCARALAAAACPTAAPTAAMHLHSHASCRQVHLMFLSVHTLHPHTHIPRTLTSHTHVTYSHSHAQLAHLSPTSFLVSSQAFLQQHQEKNLTVEWRTFVTCKSALWHVRTQCSRTEKTN